MHEHGPDHWLARYATAYHAWRKVDVAGRPAYTRPLGLIEQSFDVDGAHFGGRADVNSSFTVEIRSTLPPDQFRARLVLAWASLRLQHVMLLATVIRDAATDSREFNVQIPKDDTEVLQNAEESITFLGDHQKDLPLDDLYRHCMNSSRIIDSEKSLSRLFVLPPTPLSHDRFRVSFFIIAAHEICDGVVVLSNWEPHFLKLFNTSEMDLRRSLSIERLPERLWKRLPQAQEDLYPLVQGNVARRRWYWAIMRILRHVRKPLPQAFANPLRHPERRAQFTPLPPTYSDVLDYSPERRPPMNSFSVGAVLSRSTTDRLERLAKSVGASVGAACFTVVGMVMMEIEEARNPSIPLDQRRPFIGSFPINPRPFFCYTGPADSCMLAFSDGIWLPFLPSSLPVEGRFKLLVRQAHRQLRMYQKRLRSDKLQGSFDPTDPARIIASSYITAIERADQKRPPHLRTGVNPQGAYPANVNFASATCGVSSVGLIRKFLAPGHYKLDDAAMDERGFAADFRMENLMTGVRARDNEFLCGSWGMDDGLHFNVSYDGNAIDEEKAMLWKRKMETLFEAPVQPKL
ncbi:uncharacterized protein K452DRAFT_282907 [Aplosporella prunicola CBS 121167]|uniref:Condensation domain-containing protein n=1 Tax=Aplosporella prunicola CBS 121167 TaxID=1176127 RepID=A0A6A6BVK8_9PEZI|nr:uncharacterized protein K452DRAFT_282907 [Aplosporella prunicola CBS 121167]KAF2146721.1 hypothetical protein K452DRAFT_282907 [Aplosporella prunicola CBS 121167]